ncbi:MAG: helix-turn-helix transcriptional regulator [Flavobacteriales bacterium]|nr:helix-turn-helix transcriptional regulator [Flavobacteriales bacterium]
MLDGKKLIAAREARGVSKIALARRMGVSPSTVTKAEDDDYPGMSLKMYEKFADAVQVPLCALAKIPSYKMAIHRRVIPPPPEEMVTIPFNFPARKI